MLTSGPIRPSVPGRLRLATFVATRTSSSPSVAMQQRLQGRDERHEQRATFSMAEAFGGLRQASPATPPPAAPCGDRRSSVSDGPWRASSRAADREAALASMRAAQRCPDMTASAAASAQSPRTGSGAAPAAMSFRPEKASYKVASSSTSTPSDQPSLDDLVHGDEQEVFLLRQAHQASPNEGTLREIEGMKQLLLE